MHACPSPRCLQSAVGAAFVLQGPALMDTPEQQLQQAAGDAPCWSELPADVLELVGARFTCPQHIDSASRVCRQWQAIPQGVQALELDM